MSDKTTIGRLRVQRRNTAANLSKAELKSLIFDMRVEMAWMPRELAAVHLAPFVAAARLRERAPA